MSLSMHSSLSLAMAGLSLLLLAESPSAAQVVQLVSSSNLASTDTTAAYIGTNGNIFTTYTLTTGNNTLTFTDVASVQRLDQGTGWFGDFAPGTRVITNQESGPVTIAFNTPINELGFKIDPGTGGSLAYSLEAFDGSVSLGSVSVIADQTSSSADTAAFLGLRDLGGKEITQVQITQISAGLDYFALGPVTYGSSTVPEPGSVALLVGLGTSGALFLPRRSALRKAA